MSLNRKMICKAFSFLLVAVFLFSSFLAYLFYRDLKRTFITKVSGKSTAVIGQRVDIGDISFGALSGVSLQDVQIQNPEGFLPGRLLLIKRLSFRMNYRELFEGKLHFTKVTLKGPELTVTKDSAGRVNISDAFRRFLSKKSTFDYQLDELRIMAGTADFNNDVLLKNDRINLLLKHISSSPGAKTLIEGKTRCSGANEISLQGWADLRSEAKKFKITVRAEEFRLFPFRAILAKYPVDVENTGMRMVLDAEGGMDNGVNIVSRLQIKSAAHEFYKKPRLDISMDADVFYDIPASSARVKNLSIKVGDASALRLRGLIRDVQENPAYDFELNIDSLDLSAFNILKGFRTGGILTSDAIIIKGRFDNPLPEVSGSAELKNAWVKSDTADLREMNARMIFSSGKEISARTEASAEVLNVAGHSLSMPADVRLSLNAKVRQRDVALSAAVRASPISMEIGKEKLSLADAHLVIDGMLREQEFSGKSSVNAGRIQYADYSFNSLRGVFKVKYEKNVITILEPKIETENFSSSADLLKIAMSGRSGGLLMEARNLGAVYPAKEAELNGLDFSVSLNPADRELSGEAGFSAAEVVFQGVKSGKVAGSGKFNGKDFSLEIPQADVAGGSVRLIAEGRTSQGPFPVKAEVIADHIALGGISGAIDKYSGGGHRISGDIERFVFKGTMDSNETVSGAMFLDLRKFSLLDKKTGLYLLKDISMKSDFELQGKDCSFKSAASAGNVDVAVSGTVKALMGKGRSVSILGRLKDTPLTEIRNSFWEVFPDSLLYAGMGGSVSSDISVDYEKDKVALRGDLRLKDLLLEGENKEYSVGPINGVVPFSYGLPDEVNKPVTLPSFERAEFESISRYYVDTHPSDDHHRITIGSLQYGFRLLKDLDIWIKQDGRSVNIERFSANIFGGRLNGSAVLDLNNGVHYRAGMVLQGLSMTELCDTIEPIKGYISGKVDGIGLLKGSGPGLPDLIGRADLWTYGSKTEKTMISREFLQKIGGPSIKSYLGDRPFDKGVVSIYIQKGFLIFRELEIANRNFLGVQDLSVKVAPLNNRIAIDHLMWTIVEAANRAKKNNE